MFVFWVISCIHPEQFILLFDFKYFKVVNLLNCTNINKHTKMVNKIDIRHLCIYLLLLTFTWSCSSKEDKLSSDTLPTLDTISTVVDHQIERSLYPDASSQPIIEKPDEPAKTSFPKREKTIDKKTVTAIKPEKAPEVVIPEEIESKEEQVFMRAEQMPRFPGCERNNWTEDEKVRCSEKKLLEYIKANLKYPPQALKNNIQGEVLIKFVVDKDGNIGDAELISDPGSGMGTAAMDVIYNMKKLNQKWIPGYQQGNPVSVWFVLPIRFSLGEMKR